MGNKYGLAIGRRRGKLLIVNAMKPGSNPVKFSQTMKELITGKIVDLLEHCIKLEDNPKRQMKTFPKRHQPRMHLDHKGSKMVI